MNKLEDAIYILDGLAGDLTGGVLLLKETRRGELLANTSIQNKHIFRIAFTSLFMNCSKYVEFCKKYGELLNSEVSELSTLKNKFHNEILDRGIVSFRNDYIGHIHSRSLKRPLSHKETQSKLESCIGGEDSLPFLNWIYPDDVESVDKNTYLVGAIQQLHEALQKKL
ncbi:MULTISPECIES: hypothetical protein [unclassified Shewanella]|uniref:hypothetical protein n=1 Tax=unclassified Shewanella TaxID=196818 RepID=UPI003551C384